MSHQVEEILSRIASQVMALDEDTLVALLPKYKDKMLNFTPTRAWEESMLIYFFINGLRIKNSQFNDKLKDYMTTGDDGQKYGPHVRPRLRLVRGETTQTRTRIRTKTVIQNQEEMDSD